MTTQALVTNAGRGDLIDRYVVLDKVGQGGMGVVLAAYDPELDRKVALKLMRPDVIGDSTTARKRMQAEAQAMARLSHPNVITIHDVGEAQGRVFVAMEYAPLTLEAWLDQQPRQWQEVVAIFVQAGHGLVAAHSAGLVHLDFKPANVLLDRDGRRGTGGETIDPSKRMIRRSK